MGLPAAQGGLRTHQWWSSPPQMVADVEARRSVMVAKGWLLAGRPSYRGRPASTFVRAERRSQRSFVRNASRRLRAQHASVRSEHTGRSSP
jgi:hypothetical protein